MVGWALVHRTFDRGGFAVAPKRSIDRLDMQMNLVYACPKIDGEHEEKQISVAVVVLAQTNRGQHSLWFVSYRRAASTIESDDGPNRISTHERRRFHDSRVTKTNFAFSRVRCRSISCCFLVVISLRLLMSRILRQSSDVMLKTFEDDHETRFGWITRNDSAMKWPHVSLAYWEFHSVNTFSISTASMRLARTCRTSS